MEKKTKTAFFCVNCGYQSPKWLGRCPACGEWNKLVEETLERPSGKNIKFQGKPQPVTAIQAEEKDRWPTGMKETDRVLGGGIVPGSAVLIGGDPGIGKSTLLLQLFHHLARQGRKVLYISGEESAKQIKLRAERVGALTDSLYILVEIDLDAIMDEIEESQPEAVAIDSIQTVYSSALSSAPGSVGQIRESAEQLILMAKKKGFPLFLVGHVTKDGSIAGPKVLEHMVDTVLYFEGEAGHAFRLIRSIKNRFGPANEIGVFEMKEKGLEGVGNPSAFFLAERPEKAPGSVVSPSMEGTRPILVEIQSLVVPASGFGIPRRTVIGVDVNRVSLLIAVLDKICGYRLGGHDVFVNVAGGIKVAEPAVDLGVCASLISSFLDRPISPDTVVFGEVGLTGEIRGSLNWEARIKEASRLGFRKCIMPAVGGIKKGNPLSGSFSAVGIRSLKELPTQLF